MRLTSKKLYMYSWEISENLFLGRKCAEYKKKSQQQIKVKKKKSVEAPMQL